MDGADEEEHYLKKNETKDAQQKSFIADSSGDWLSFCDFPVQGPQIGPESENTMKWLVGFIFVIETLTWMTKRLVVKCWSGVL